MIQLSATEASDASADTLMRQAPATAELYVREGVKFIDDMFGEGYCKKNPALLAEFVRACSMDYSVSFFSAQMRGGIESLVHAISALKSNEGD